MLWGHTVTLESAEAPSTTDSDSEVGSGEVGPRWRRRHTRSRRRRCVVITSIAFVIAICSYLAYLIVDVKSSIDDARRHGIAAKAAIMDGDVHGAQLHAAAAESAADSARSATDNPVWRATAAIPWLGSPLQSVHQMTESVADTAAQVLVPSAALAQTISPSTLRGPDNALNLKPLAAAQPRLAEIATNAERIDERTQHIPGSWLEQVSDARTQLVDQIAETARFLRGTDLAAQIAPSMLGVDGARSYFVAMQTPSEARGTGGLVGGFAILGADNGYITTPRLGQNLGIEEPAGPQVDLGPDHNRLYGWTRAYLDVRNSNMSPDFTDAARIWIANWKAQTGQRLDGAVAVDPIALSYVLKVAGPVTLTDGEEITAENVAPITLSTSYERFASDNDARKEYLQSISKAVFDRMSSLNGNTNALLEALGRGVQERRIMVYSSHTREQRILESMPLGHQVADTSAPYMNATLVNVTANKTDYYLRREITYTAGGCAASTRESTARIRLTNTLTDTSLPDYVIGNRGNRQIRFPQGTNYTNLQVLLTKGATPRRVTVDGATVNLNAGTLHSHPAVFVQVPIPPGKSAEVTVTSTEPTSAHGEAVVPVQPLVDNPTLRVDVPVCGPAG